MVRPGRDRHHPAKPSNPAPIHRATSRGSGTAVASTDIRSESEVSDQGPPNPRSRWSSPMVHPEIPVWAVLDVPPHSTTGAVADATTQYVRPAENVSGVVGTNRDGAPKTDVSVNADAPGTPPLSPWIFTDNPADGGFKFNAKVTASNVAAEPATKDWATEKLLSTEA